MHRFPNIVGIVRRAKSLAVILLILGGSNSAQAVDYMRYPINLSGAGDLRSLADDVINVLADTSISLERQKSLLRQTLRPIMDFDTIADSVLGAYQGDATELQFRRYHELISEYVLSSLSRFLASHPAKEFEVVDIVATDGLTSVVSQVTTLTGETMEWEWHLKRGDVAYRVVDIEAYGISLAGLLGNEVGAVLRYRGFEGLLRTLESRL